MANPISIKASEVGLPGSGTLQQGDIETLLMNVYIVAGIVAVIVIIIGGIRYTTSGSESSNIKAAKDTILYAVVGLIVAILSYAIVNFVLGRFSGGS